MEFKDREKRKYNEMTEKEKLINLKPLNAYETLDKDIQNKMIPGYMTVQERENYRRFNRKGIGKNDLLNTNISSILS